MPLPGLKTALFLRRAAMNGLMATRWYPAIRYHLRKRASTGTGAMKGPEFAAHVGNTFDTYRKHLRGRMEDFSGLRVLEIGPGEHLGIAMLFIASGARQVVCIDRWREVRHGRPPVAAMYVHLYKALHAPEERTRWDRAFPILHEAGCNPLAPIRYLPNTPLERAERGSLGTFDLIVSTSVLEHVSDLEQSIQAMYGLLNPGGWIAHCVDLASHDRYEAYPLAFLETSETLWNLQFSNIGGPNRCRKSAYQRFLECAGFRDIHILVDRQFPLDAIERVRRSGLAEPFRDASDEDLAAEVIFICARKGIR